MDKLERLREKGIDPHAEEKPTPKSRGSMRAKVDSKLAGTTRDKFISQEKLEKMHRASAKTVRRID